MRVLALMKCAPSSRPPETSADFVEVCVFAGMRLGEAAGLQLADINFLGRSIRVSRRVQGSTIKAAKLVPPKYHAERTVYVPGELTASLSAHISRHAITDLDEQLFTTPLGRLWNRNNAAGELRRIRGEVGLPDDVTLHTLRRTFASNLIASGCDPCGLNQENPWSGGCATGS